MNDGHYLASSVGELVAETPRGRVSRAFAAGEMIYIHALSPLHPAAVEAMNAGVLTPCDGGHLVDGDGLPFAIGESGLS